MTIVMTKDGALPWAAQKDVGVWQTHNAARSLLCRPHKESHFHQWQRKEEERIGQQQNVSKKKNMRRRRKSVEGEKARKHLGERQELVVASAAEEKAGTDGRMALTGARESARLSAAQPRWRAPFSGRAGSKAESFLPGSVTAVSTGRRLFIWMQRESLEGGQPLQVSEIFGGKVSLEHSLRDFKDSKQSCL